MRNDVTRAHVTSALVTSSLVTRAHVSKAYFISTYVIRAHMTRVYVTRLLVTRAHSQEALPQQVMSFGVSGYAWLCILSWVHDAGVELMLLDVMSVGYLLRCTTSLSNFWFRPMHLIKSCWMYFSIKVNSPNTLCVNFLWWAPCHQRFSIGILIFG